MNKFHKIVNLKNIFKIILIELYIVTAQLIWNCKDIVLSNIITIPPVKLGDKILFYIYNGGLLIVLLVIALAIIITLFKPNREKELKGMEDIGLKNQSDEHPRCVKILDGDSDNQKIYVFKVNNISLEQMKNKRDGLESLYNIQIDYMSYGASTKYINVYCTPRECLEPKTFSIGYGDHFLDDFISAIIVGSTGSGKTYFTYQLLGKVLMNKSIQNEDVITFICDRKNEDFIQFKDTSNYYGVNAVDGINKVYQLFEERLNDDEDCTNKPTIVCLIEEYALLLNMLEKKEAEDIKMKVAKMLFAGRSKKIITILSMQRADAVYFPTGAKEQFKNVIMMGEISDIQLDMLLDEDHKNQVTEINPQGYGYLYEQGKRKLTRFKVSKIEDYEKELIDSIIRNTMN
jgi:hypothetical protein